MLIDRIRSRSLHYSIHSLTSVDEPFLWEMLFEAAHMAEEGETSIQVVMNHPEIAKYVKGWGRAGDLGFKAIASANQQPIGAAWVRLFTREDQGYGYVDDATPELAIAVLPEHRGQGVGTQLLTHLLEAAKLAYPAVSLSTRATNPALHLYQRFHFKAVDRSEVINRTGGTSFTMKIEFQ